MVNHPMAQTVIPKRSSVSPKQVRKVCDFSENEFSPRPRHFQNKFSPLRMRIRVLKRGKQFTVPTTVLPSENTVSHDKAKDVQKLMRYFTVPDGAKDLYA